MSAICPVNRMADEVVMRAGPRWAKLHLSTQNSSLAPATNFQTVREAASTPRRAA